MALRHFPAVGDIAAAAPADCIALHGSGKTSA
jgi:hypothetical protein